MKAARRLKHQLERRRWLAISITIVAGLLIGLGFSLWQSGRSYRERSISSLITDLQKKDSPFNLLHQRLWPHIPDRLQSVMGGRFAPTQAKQVRLAAAAELRGREPKPTNALPVLRLLLRDSDMDVRKAGLDTLQGWGTAAQPLTPDVIVLVRDQAGSTFDVRIQAIRTVAWIARDDPATVEALLAALKDTPMRPLAGGGMFGGSMFDVRHAAASALGGLARPGNGVVAALVAALEDSELGFAATVVEALGQAGPEEPEAVSAVIAAFERGRKSLAALRSENAENSGDLPAVSVVRTYPPPEFEWVMFRSGSLAALEKLAQPQNGAVTAILSALSEAEAGFDSEILFALGRIGAITPEIVPAIVNVMERRSIPAAFEALVQLGPAAARAVPNLVAMLQPLARQPQSVEQPAAASTPRDAQVSGLFPARLVQRRTQLSRFSLSLQTLGKIGPAAREALPLLTRIIQVQTKAWRYEALMARWQIDHHAESALPGLIEGMADPEREMRLRLVQCFQEMGISGLDGLLAALRDADYEVRRNAVQALGQLGPAAEKAVLHLEPLLEDPKNTVRFVAENALKQIQPTQAGRWKAKLRIPVGSRGTAP